MNALLVLIWLALCVLLFLVCRVPMNRWTAPAATLGGILLTAGPIVAMDHYHPYSGNARPAANAVPIAAPVAGTVVKIAVAENQQVRQGELLFNIDPEPFRLEVRALEARAEQARSTLRQASAGGAREFAQSRLTEFEARLAQALYRLKQTSVRAPVDGRVVDLAIVTGQELAVAPARPAMRLVGADNARVVARVRQNQLSRIEPGAPAEVSFDALPGRVFTAEVVRVAPPAESTMAASDPGAEVRLRINDPRFDAAAPIGSAQAAVYGAQMPEIALLRRLLLRMAAWVDYVYPYG